MSWQDSQRLFAPQVLGARASEMVVYEKDLDCPERSLTHISNTESRLPSQQPCLSKVSTYKNNRTAAARGSAS